MEHRPCRSGSGHRSEALATAAPHDPQISDCTRASQSELQHLHHARPVCSAVLCRIISLTEQISCRPKRRSHTEPLSMLHVCVSCRLLASHTTGDTAGKLARQHSGVTRTRTCAWNALGLVVGRGQRLAAGDVGAVHLAERRQRGHRVAVLQQRAQRAQEVHALRVRGEPGVPAMGLGF